MINLKHEILGFQSVDLKVLEDSGNVMPDNIKNSVILYNKSLESIRQNSEDIAIIELKKAISMNPHFHEAINLLGICYMYNGDNLKASEMFNRVVAEENNSVKALGYLNTINRVEETPKATETKKRSKLKRRVAKDQQKNEPIAPMQKTKDDRKYDFSRFISGFVIGAILVLVISLIVIQGEDAKGKAVNSSNASIQGNIDMPKEDVEKLKNDLNAAAVEADYYKNVIKLYQVDAHVAAKKYDTAADMLLLLKTIPFKDEDKIKFDSMYSTVMTEAARLTYNKGMTSYNRRVFAEAVKEFNKTVSYGDVLYVTDAALYYMARSYEELKDSRNAVEAFQKIVTTYPKGNQYVGWAEMKIRQLTPAP